MIKKYNNVDELLNDCPKNKTICDNLIIAWSKINNPLYDKISCSISGGSDSDILLDLVYRIDKNNKVQYVFFDTGLEYQATKDHLRYLENKYGININVKRPVKPIPICCNEFGKPFINKRVSEYINRLQKHGFKWEDKPFEVLYKEYPKCKSALRWWCNEWGENSQLGISNNKWLKEFLIENPPKFAISSKCCDYAKKKVSYNFKKENNIELNIYGVRKAEGGARATAYKNCFSYDINGIADYRPLFWYKNFDKEEYENTYCIKHSKCYTKYGLSRTGCAGCPFGRDFEKELEVIKEYEPKLYKAVNNIFGLSYEYTRKYRQYCEKMNEKVRKNNDLQTNAY